VIKNKDTKSSQFKMLEDETEYKMKSAAFKRLSRKNKDKAARNS
jgi:hypothetical protein